MNHKKAIVYLLAAFFGCFSSPVNAQFNLKTGYNISFLTNPSLDQVIHTFSQSQAYTSSFHDLRWLHGIEAGGRFKSGAHAFELTYQGAYQHLKAEGEVSGSNEVYKDKIRFAINTAAIGYQLSGEIIGFGTDLQYQWYANKVSFGQSEEVFKDFQKMLALKVYLMVTLAGNNGVDMVLQPYWVMPFETYDLAPLNQYLNQEGDPGSEKWTRFGLTVLFYNGEK